MLPLFASTSGVLVWSPLPQFPFVDGDYAKYLNTQNTSYPGVCTRITEPAVEDVIGSDLFTLFDSQARQSTSPTRSFRVTA